MNSIAVSRSKLLALAGLAACALSSVVLVATSSAGKLEAHERSAPLSCHVEQVALDRGYGVTRVAEQRVCEEI